MCECNESWWQYGAIVLGGLFALVQWERSLRISRSRFVQKKLADLHADFVQDVLTCQDSCEDAWLTDRLSQGQKDFEYHVRQTLDILDELSHLYLIGNIGETDLKLFLPILLRLINDPQVIAYIDEERAAYQERVKRKELLYGYLVMLGKVYGLSDHRFSDYKFGGIGWMLLSIRRLVSRMFCLISACAQTKSNDENSIASEPVKIGAFVTGRFKDAIVACAEKDEQMLKNLEDSKYSKENFCLAYPVLMKADNIDVHLNRRYYVNEFEICGSSYRLCNNWYEKQRKSIESWLRENTNVR